MNVFSTDNNLQFNFNTGANIEHKLLVGIDYSWNKIAKRYAGGDELVDLYDIDYDSLAPYDPSGPFTTESQNKDRKRVVKGQRVQVRVNPGGRTFIKKKKT